MIIPTINQIQLKEDVFVLGKGCGLWAGPSDSEYAMTCLALFLPCLQVELRKDQPEILALKKDLPSEFYRMTIGDQILIEHGDYLGLRNALATLSCLASGFNERYKLPKGVFEDYPAAAHRGVMLDLGRDVKPFDELIADIVLMAKAKMNILHLHLFDHMGCAVDLSCLPRECIFEKHYSREQISKLVHVANVLGLEIIPEFDLPAHSKKLAKFLPVVSCQVEDNTFWTTCAGVEDTYDLYKKVIQEIVDLFPGGRYFHIGGDELEFGDLPHLNYLCHWETCPACRRKMQEEVLQDRQELYYYLILRIYDIVKNTGRQMILWSDQIDCTRPCPLPKDVILHFWRIPAPGRGPREGFSLNAQLAMGYRVINSYYPDTYIDEEQYMSSKTIRDWRWDRRPEVEECFKGQIIGSEMCVWSYGGTLDPRFRPDQFRFYSRVFPSATILMGDKLWGGEELIFNEAYQQKLTKAVLGPHTPTGMNLWKAFGDIIPPRDPDVYAYYDQIECEVQEIKDMYNALLKILGTGDSIHINSYIHALNVIIEKIQNKK